MFPHFVNFLREWGHDVVLFGHTWKHSLPNDIPIDFTLFDDIRITDQQKLREWILEDEESRKIAPTVDETIDRFLGQVWSGIHCFTTFGHRCIEDYDFHIRWRWDLFFDIEKDEFFQNRAGDFNNELYRSYEEDSHIPSIITSSMGSLFGYELNDQIVYKGTIEDRFFALNKSSMERIICLDTNDILSSTLKFYKNLKSENFKSPHTLWWDILFRNTGSEVKFMWHPYLIDSVR